MVEKVAEALFAAEGLARWSRQSRAVHGRYMRRVLAVLEAIREPTEAMLAAGGNVSIDDWHAMIDEAICPNGKA